MFSCYYDDSARSIENQGREAGGEKRAGDGRRVAPAVVVGDATAADGDSRGTCSSRHYAGSCIDGVDRSVGGDLARNKRSSDRNRTGEGRSRSRSAGHTVRTAVVRDDAHYACVNRN